VTVAVELVRERGYSGMDLDAVCARAKVSRRTVYELIGGREACFLAVLEAAVAHVSASMRKAFEEASRGGEADGVRAALERLLAFIEDEPELAKAMVVDVLNGGALVVRYRSGVLARLAEGLEGAWNDPGTTALPWPSRADWIVAGLFGVLHSRLAIEEPARDFDAVKELVNPLMALTALVYVGRGAAEEELKRPVRAIDGSWAPSAPDPFVGLRIRITRRVLSVLGAIGELPGSSSREVAVAAGVRDAGQASKLLARLAANGLIENTGATGRWAEKAWRLTVKGEEVLGACGGS